MLGEYKISRASRRCSVQERLLQPGEVYFSVVIEKDEELQRQDISSDAWDGPPEGCIGHWKNRVPVPGDKKRELAPPEVLIELLRCLGEQSGKSRSRFLLALMLIRKRQIQLVETRKIARDQEMIEVMAVQIPSTKETLEIVVDDIDPAEQNSLQAELIELIYRETE